MNILHRLTVASAVILSAGSVRLFAQGEAPAQNPMASFIPLIVIFLIFYFLIIRPQQAKAKEHQKLLNALKKDDRIVTTGGLYGTVTAVRGDVLEVKIAEGVKVQIARSAVSSVLPPEGTVPPEGPTLIK